MSDNDQVETTRFARRAFYVEAVQVTLDNMSAVTEWCGGVVESMDSRNGLTNYVKVPVSNPASDRQTRAFLGDWVLKAGTTFKVYTAKAFESSFEPTNEPRCNNTTTTKDGQPCVFGIGHRNGENPTGCRSFADYKVL